MQRRPSVNEAWRVKAMLCNAEPGRKRARFDDPDRHQIDPNGVQWSSAMGRKTAGIDPGEEGTWQVDKWYRGTRPRQRGFASLEEAVGRLMRRLEQLLAVEVHGQRAQRLFSEVAAYYLAQHQDKASIVSETCRLTSVPTIGHLPIHHVHDGTLAPHVEMRLDAGRSHKTVNPELAIVRRILNLCATRWRDDVGNTWLEQAPRITLLPRIGHQRALRPPGDVAARTRGGAARRDASPPKVPGQRKTG
jgi:hypothetical protein